jgi:5-methylcytosine-specific restriction endonuclease McrA
MELDDYKTLKLDATYRPVAVIPATEALVSSMMGKAVIVETHDRTIHSATLGFKLPAVIATKRVTKNPKQFACNKKFVFIRDTGCCQYCGEYTEYEASTLDHVIPRSQGGSSEWDNIVLSCYPCNQKKGPRPPHKANMDLIRKPRPLTYAQYLYSSNAQSDAWKDYF